VCGFPNAAAKPVAKDANTGGLNHVDILSYMLGVRGDHRLTVAFRPIGSIKGRSFGGDPLWWMLASVAASIGRGNARQVETFPFRCLGPDRRARCEQEPHHEGHRRSRLHA